MQAPSPAQPPIEVAQWRHQCETLSDLLFVASARAQLKTGAGLFLHTKEAELHRFVERMLADLKTRKRRGALRLEQMYQGSLAGLSTIARRELLIGFCQSPWFREYGEVVGRHQQVCMEEAFYRYLCAQEIGACEPREIEFLDAMLRAVAVQPCPAFALPRELQKAEFGVFALATLHGQNMLFARIGQRLIRGPISHDHALFLRQRGVWSSAGELTQKQWRAASTELAGTGLLF